MPMDITYIPMAKGFVYLAVVRPDLIGPRDIDAAQQIRKDLVSRLRLCRPRPAIQGFYPHPLHQRLHVTPAHLAPFGSQKTAQHPRPCERELSMKRVDLLHEHQVFRRHRAGQVVDRAPRDADQLGLLRNAQRVITVDHRFALSNPALVSAPSKKSFSSVSSPILACRAFTSTGGSRVVPVPAPNTSDAPSSSCAFQVVTSFGWTSNCSAIFALVPSPLIAAIATSALNYAQCSHCTRLSITFYSSRGT